MTPEPFFMWARANPRLFTAACFSAAVLLPLATAALVLLAERWATRRAR